ncbi:MAG: hypothetical protein J6O50_12400, partial [Ruminiclostridium sp.]|nr:hypothetical protein [Ruminiclostridium sp.]
AAAKVFLERERGRGEREKPFFTKKGFLSPPRGVGQSPTRASADALREDRLKTPVLDGITAGTGVVVCLVLFTLSESLT